MEELNEEEMKNIGGACKGTAVKKGYRQMVLTQRGWTTIDVIPRLKLNHWHLESYGGGSAGGKVIDGVKLSGERLNVHTLSTIGYFHLVITLKGGGGVNTRKEYKIQFVHKKLC